MTNHQKKYYLTKFINKIFVIKIGGEIIRSKKILENILKDIKNLSDCGVKIILIHGGGTQADELSKKLGHTPKKINGRRITNKEDLEIVKMIYGGSLNLEILSIMQKLSLKGIRVSGLDGQAIVAKKRSKKENNYGFVGDIIKINKQILVDLLDKNYLPVISPLAADKNGVILNINADTIATKMAIALKATKLILFTNKDGVYGKKQTLLSTLTKIDIEKLIKTKVVKDGMRVKMENCIYAINNGVKRIHIINGLSRYSLLNEVLTKQGVGTMIITEQENKVYLAEHL